MYATLYHNTALPGLILYMSVEAPGCARSTVSTRG